ncbi:VWA domain-containing protein [Zobellia amurskyensis]|uniref:VWA domain-containing protein n=1 Tax=Zobellia amurskyensis TaxID=248905 RepID=A0A7X2ZX12_9FLAO|nr:VWA domain-containing protein [Zobellia amurskyensis]MUH37914.1 VWA domain-containing protein [Zobellia amurskyensis]
MNTQTILLIILAVIVSLALVLFQYFYKNKRSGKLNIVLSFLRFITFFCGFLLLINPKFTKNEYTTEKANLIVLADNSSSVASAKSAIHQTIKSLEQSDEIIKRFAIEKYSFGSFLKEGDSLSFQDKNTNISQALSALKDVYSTTNSTIVLISDGNQTLGRDYDFQNEQHQFPIYPIAVGDTTRYEDVAISQVNTNRYAFLKNKYPVQIYVSYSGQDDVSVPVRISLNEKNVFRQTVSFSSTNSSEVINTLLDANSIGSKSLRISVGSLDNERNTANNNREVVVDVIDEKTSIALVSNIVHPDIGALKKSIESNGQRSVSIKNPKADLEEWEEVDLFILYQPNATFKGLFDYIENKKANSFTITGPKTDRNFLNRIQKGFTKNSYNQEEEVFGVLNSGFSLFNTLDFSVEEFPPLQSSLGDVVLHGKNDVLLTQRIRGVDLNQPLLAVFEEGQKRDAVLFGENIWKWRMQNYRNTQSFKNFDDFIGKLTFYLASNKSRERLSLNYENVYSGSNEARISATYFDKTFVFDANAEITLKLQNSESKKTSEVPMLLRGSYYEADLSNLSAGKYDFSVAVKKENLSKSGSFTILDFDVEKQFLSTNYEKLQRLAQNTSGRLFYPNQNQDLIQDLLSDDRYLPTQKNKQNVVSLIDYRLLLGLMVIALATEWFLRKYNGLT